MAAPELLTKLHNSEVEFPCSADVVIVGARLSGLFLASLIPEHIRTIVIDQKPASPFKDAYYLVNKATSNRWDMNGRYTDKKSHQPLISGMVTFDQTGKVVESLKPNTDNSYGFAALPQAVLEKELTARVCSVGHPVFYHTRYTGLRIRPDSGIDLGTTGGKVCCNLIIDATGWEGIVMHQYYGDEEYVVRALFGGSHQSQGFDPRMLYFVDGFQYNKANWIMPICDKSCEVIAGQETYRSRAGDWWNTKAEPEFAKMLKWYRERNYQILPNGYARQMAFREQPTNRKNFQGLVVPFGEAAGLNSPLVGQLIDVLPFYAQILSKIIVEADRTRHYETVGQRFYEEFLKRPPFYYLLHSIFRENRMRPGRTRCSANSLLTRALTGTFDRMTLWKLIQENGLGVKETLNLLQKHPLELTGWVVSSTPSILTLMISSPDLFLQFYLTARERLVQKLKRQEQQLY